MLNFILKTVLYFILSVCVAWGIILLCGPQAIHFFAQKKFGNSVQIHNLRVTPKLAVVASRVEISKPSLSNNYITAGSLRAVELNWQFSNKLVPKILLSVGPSSIENLFDFKEANIEISILEAWTSDYFGFEFYSKGLKWPNLSKVENIRSVGKFNYRKSEYRDVEFSSNGITSLSAVKFQIPVLEGAVQKAKFTNKKNYFDSIINMTLSAEEIYFEKQNLLLNDFYGKYTFKSDAGYLDLKIKKVHDKENNFVADNVKLASSMGSFDVSDLDQAVINFETLQLPLSSYYGNESFLQNFSATLERSSSNNISIASSGRFGKFELLSPDGFLANLSGAKFNSAVDLNNGLLSSDTFVSRINLQSDSAPSIIFSGEGKLLLSQADYMVCFIANGCDAQLWADYYFQSEESKLTGSSYCVLPSCVGNGSNHFIKTENTSEFFASVIKSQVFNPFFVALAYSNLSSGAKVGDGHALKF